MTKPMLATDWVEGKVRLPSFIQPKYDGVRAGHLIGYLTGRSLKKHRNKYTTAMFSDAIFAGLDGEMAAGMETSESLCRDTTSALNTIEGEPFILWHLFDYITEATINLPYDQRYALLCERVHMLQNSPLADHHPGIGRLRIMPSYVVTTMEEVKQGDSYFCGIGCEGSILRYIHGAYKQGRSTVKEGWLLRIKHFVEEDAVVVAVIEGRTNTNEATKNELGLTERSTHSEQMIPNGMVGALDCIDEKTRQPIRVAAGTMTHEDRKNYFENQHLILQKHIKYKKFLKGEKDKPRFPTFQSIRMESDKA